MTHKDYYTERLSSRLIFISKLTLFLILEFSTKNTWSLWNEAHEHATKV